MHLLYGDIFALYKFNNQSINQTFFHPTHPCTVHVSVCFVPGFQTTHPVWPDQGADSPHAEIPRQAAQSESQRITTVTTYPQVSWWKP
jgi:hypothetical protein